jgi:hypothetical protein
LYQARLSVRSRVDRAVVVTVAHGDSPRPDWGRLWHCTKE